MKTLLGALLPVSILLTGCTPGPPATTLNPASRAASSESLTSEKRREPVEVDTAEIIRILEEEDIAFVYTNHFQLIIVELKDGRAYKATYVHEEAGKYAKDKNLFDVLNLVGRIMQSRPPEQVKDWQFQTQ